MTAGSVGGGDRFATELAGLDRLAAPRSRARTRVTRSILPKVAAIAFALLAWQLIAMSGWRPSYLLPGPAAVFDELVADLGDGTLLAATLVTLQRAALGFVIAIVVGGVIGLAVARWPLLRAAVGSLITGLQTMPSIAWFPLAILLFGLTEGAILFVVILGAAPAIANGLISGIDQVPPVLQRAGRVLGARGFTLQRHVILPAALPSTVAGLKQGWAFAWRSLMAGELLVIVAGTTSLGVRLQFARELSDAEALLAAMIVILVIGIVIDGLVFASAERWIRTRWGLVEST